MRDLKILGWNCHGTVAIPVPVGYDRVCREGKPTGREVPAGGRRGTEETRQRRKDDGEAMTVKKMVREVEDAAEGMILPKHTDEVAAEVREKMGDLVEGIGSATRQIADAADTMLGLDQLQNPAADKAVEKVGQLAKEVADAADVMINGESLKK